MSDEIVEKRFPTASEVFEDPALRRAAAAAEAGDVAQLRGLEIDLDTMAPGGVNLLMYEISAQNEVAVRTLLDAGADPNVLTPTGSSPMLLAAVMPEARFLGILLDKGGDPNHLNHAKEPLLTRLVFHQQWDNILVLLDRGADINKTGPSGQTAAYLFGSLHQFDRVFALLERGADPHVKTASGLELRNFVTQRVAPDSPQASWQKKVAERIEVG
jgi:uncharacterized protein